MPENPKGEDDFAVKNYQTILSEQHNCPAHKHKQNIELINSLMKKTFPHRRHILVKDMVRLSELFQMYPILCSEEQVFLILLL